MHSCEHSQVANALPLATDQMYWTIHQSLIIPFHLRPALRPSRTSVMRRTPCVAATAKISGGAECALRWRRIAAVAALGRAEWDPPVPATCTTTATDPATSRVTALSAATATMAAAVVTMITTIALGASTRIVLPAPATSYRPAVCACCCQRIHNIAQRVACYGLWRTTLESHASVTHPPRLHDLAWISKGVGFLRLLACILLIVFPSDNAFFDDDAFLCTKVCTAARFYSSMREPQPPCPSDSSRILLLQV